MTYRYRNGSPFKNIRTRRKTLEYQNILREWMCGHVYAATHPLFFVTITLKQVLGDELQKEYLTTDKAHTVAKDIFDQFAAKTNLQEEFLRLVFVEGGTSTKRIHLHAIIEMSGHTLEEIQSALAGLNSEWLDPINSVEEVTHKPGKLVEYISKDGPDAFCPGASSLNISLEHKQLKADVSKHQASIRRKYSDSSRRKPKEKQRRQFLNKRTRNKCGPVKVYSGAELIGVAKEYGFSVSPNKLTAEKPS